MADSRNSEIVEDLSKPTSDDITDDRSRLLELPVEKLYNPDENEPSIIGVMPDNEAKAAIRNLSETCKSLHQLFYPEREKHLAKRLLEYVLQGNETKVVEMAKWQPELFFIPSTAQDYAMDLEGNRRTIKNYSPVQAMVATGDKEMFKAVQPYLDALPNGRQRIQEQIKEKFPNGTDYPPCTDEFNRLIKAVAAAINNDQQIRWDWKNPNTATLQALEEFRNYLTKTHLGIIEKGHHFNLNNFIKTEEFCADRWRFWNGNQLSFFLVKVMAFQQRLCTAWQMQGNCTGFYYYVEKNRPLARHFKIKKGMKDKEINIFPLDNEDPSYRLGDVCYVENYSGSNLASGGEWRLLDVLLLQSYVKQIQQNFRGLFPHQSNKRRHAT